MTVSAPIPQYPAPMPFPVRPSPPELATGPTPGSATMPTASLHQSRPSTQAPPAMGPMNSSQIRQPPPHIPPRAKMSRVSFAPSPGASIHSMANTTQQSYYQPSGQVPSPWGPRAPSSPTMQVVLQPLYRGHCLNRSQLVSNMDKFHSLNIRTFPATTGVLTDIWILRWTITSASVSMLSNPWESQVCVPFQCDVHTSCTLELAIHTRSLTPHCCNVLCNDSAARLAHLVLMLYPS